MPSWNALPFEIKSLIFDHVLGNALQIDHESEPYHSCVKLFALRYYRFMHSAFWSCRTTRLSMFSGGHFLVYLERCSGGPIYRSSSSQLHQCLVNKTQTGWTDIKSLMEAAPELESFVHARLAKEFKAMQGTFVEDRGRFEFKILQKLAKQGKQAQAANAMDGMKKEIMKGLCYRSHLATLSKNSGSDHSNQKEEKCEENSKKMVNVAFDN